MPSPRRSSARSARSRPGRTIQAWTLEWDEDAGVLRKMRSKETEADYRYFREPDLLPIHLDDAWREAILAELPELPLERRARFEAQYGLPAYDADILTSERKLSDYFEAAVKAYGGDPKRVSNWMMNDVLRMINDRGTPADRLKLSPQHLAEILRLVDAGTINTSTGKSLLGKVEESGRPPAEIVQAEGLAKGERRRRHPDGCRRGDRRKPQRGRVLPVRQSHADRLVRRAGDAEDARQGRPEPRPDDPGGDAEKLTPGAAASWKVLVHKNREILLFAPVYFFLSFIELAVKLWLTPSWFNGMLDTNHKLLLQFQYTNNEQSRLLQFYAPEFFHQVFGLTIQHSYMVTRFLFIFLAFACFHLYLRKWFSREAAFAGALFLAAVLPFTFLDDLQESAPGLMLFFLLGLWALRERKDGLFVLALVAGGGLTNETMLILPLVYLCDRLDWKAGWQAGLKTAYRTAVVAFPAYLVQGVIRYINRDRPHLNSAWHLPENLIRIRWALGENPLDMYKAYYLFDFFLYSVFWLYALLGYRKSPRFLQRASWMVPVFFLANLVTGIIREARQMIPVAFIIIPMAMFFLFTPLPETAPARESLQPGEAAPDFAAAGDGLYG